jgi:hypothetical protein
MKLKNILKKLEIVNETKALKVEIMCLTIAIFVICLGMWAIDVGVSGMLMEAQMGVEIYAGNGWQFRRAVQQYHMGLYLVIAGMFLMIWLCVVVVVDKHKTAVETKWKVPKKVTE